jgi:hypothetical protein
MNRLALLLPVALLAGCSDRRAELESRIASQQETIQALEQRVVELEKARAAVEGAPRPADIQRYARQVGLAQKDMERDIRALQAQVEQLKSGRAKPAVADVAPAAETVAPEMASTSSAPMPRPVQREEAYTAGVSIYRPPNVVLEDFIEPPTDPQADLFPVAIADVRSEKIVTGTYETTEIVTSDELNEDYFGDKVPLLKEKSVKKDEHDYQVRFHARNLTKTPKDITAGAGRDSVVVTLQPGEVATNLAVYARFGADLTVRSRGEVRRFEVEYED